MKKNSFLITLATIALILGLWATLQAVRYYFVTRQLAVAQAKVNGVQIRLNYAQSLVAEALEYSRRNPAIDPILQNFNFKPRPQTNTTPAPAALKSATR